MSWDFSMDIDVGGKEPATVYDDLNYTCNVSSMYYDAIGGQGVRDLAGKLGSECIPILTAAIARMANDPTKYRAMNPKNGWGNYTGALKLLRALLRWCEEAPLATMRIA